jgi:REP element-mobilizing transposase RayT
MLLSKMGEITKIFWEQIHEHYPFVNLDAFIIMPNHIHGIVIIDKSNPSLEAQNFASLQHNDYTGNKFGHQSQSLAAIIRAYKAAFKKYATMNDINFIWQPRYYDRIVINEQNLFNIRKYIIYNSSKWEGDKYYL